MTTTTTMSSDCSTVAQVLKQRVHQCGEDTPYFIFRDWQGGRQEFTLGRVHQLAGRCAAFFRDKGIGKGSRVIVRLDNSPERLVCDFGLLYAGAVCINGAHQMTDGSDLIHCIRHSRASAILLDPDVAHSAWKPLQNVVHRADDGAVTSEQLPDLRRVEFVRRQAGTGFLDRLEQASDWWMEDTVQRSDDCFVFTTSGTTGFPKLVAQPHHNFLTAIETVSRGATWSTEWSVGFVDIPLGTGGGNVTVPFLANEARVLCDVRAGLPEDRAAFIADCIRDENCTRANLSVADLMALHQRLKGGDQETPAPPLLPPFNGSKNGGGHDQQQQQRQQDHQQKQQQQHHHHPTEGGSVPQWRPLERVSLGGQPLTGRAVEAALDLARTVLIYYGTTEVSLISVSMVTQQGDYEDYNVGRPMPGIQVKVVDEATETVLPEGQIGHVLVRHPNPFRDYLYCPDDPTTTTTTTTRPRPSKAAAFTADGFYRTGDRGKVNPDKSLTIFGRTGDAVITRGPRVFYPHVLEAAIRQCPGVVDVVIVGVPDPLTTEEFCACVVLQEGAGMERVEEEVGEKCAGPSLTLHSLRPRYYLRFEALPQLYTGRPDRRSIKQMAREKLALE